MKVALMWYVYHLTGSAMKMTVIGLLQTVPPLLLGPVIGVYVDRFPKRGFMIVMEVGRAATTLLIPVLHTWGLLSLGWLYVLILVTAMFAAVFTPALSATVPLVAPKEQLTGANAWIQSTATLGMVIGPAISGTGIAMIGVENVLYIGAPMFVASALLLMPVNVKEDLKSRRGEHSFAAVKEELLTGLRFIFRESGSARMMMVTSICHSLAASAFVFLLPVYAEKVVHVGASQLGWYWSMYGVGMLAVSATLGFLKQGDAAMRYLIMAGALGTGAVGAVGLATWTSFWLGLLFIALIGGSLAVVTPVIWALLQEETPSDMRGRVFSTFGSGAMVASMIGILGFGWAADHLGARISLYVMAGILMLTVAMGLRLRAVAQRGAQAKAKGKSKKEKV